MHNKTYKTINGEQIAPFIIPTSEFVNDIIHPTQIESTLSNLDVSCKVVEIIPAPQAITYKLRLAETKKINTVIKNVNVMKADCMADCIYKFSKTAHLELIVERVKKATLGLVNTVFLSDYTTDKYKYPLILGQGVDGIYHITETSNLPHMMIAGCSGSGKSVALDSILTCLLIKHSPHTLKLVLIDPKQVGLKQYEGIPHLDGQPVFTNGFDVQRILSVLVDLMRKRNDIMMANGFTDSDQAGFAKIVVVIDEFADLMAAYKTTLVPLVDRLTAVGRAAGIHIILATQRPTVGFVPGSIKANCATRIALKCATFEDSKAILGRGGAEHLAGNGDGLLMSPFSDGFTRIQSPFVSKELKAAVIKHWRDQA